MKIMEANVWQEFVFKQVPLVIILIGLVYFMYRYFTALQEKREVYFQSVIAQRDKIIEGKDDLIMDQNEKLMTLTQQNTQALLDLRRSIDDLRKEHMIKA